MAKNIQPTVAQMASAARSATQKALDEQPTVRISLELRDGEPREETVTINDCKYVIPRGEAVDVPEQVAEMIEDKLKAERKMAQLSRVMMEKMDKGESGDLQTPA